MGRSMDGLLQTFNQNADEAAKLLKNALEHISKGYALDEEAASGLFASIETLRQSYQSVCQMAREELPAQEMPEDGQPALVYAEAFANNQAVRYRKRIASARDSFCAFAAVESPVSVYVSALAPYQDTARQWAARLDREEPQAEEIEEAVKGPELFLKALSCDDFDSEESISLLEQLAEYYPSRVQMGAAARKYFMAGMNAGEQAAQVPEDTAPEEAARNTAPKEAAAERETMPEETAAVRESAPEETAAVQESAPEETAAAQESAPEEAAAEQEAEPESSFAAALKASGALLDPKENIGFLSSDISTAEDKKITASIFMNDMRKGAERTEKRVIQELSGNTCINAGTLFSVRRVAWTTGESVLEYLYKKGYLRRYRLLSRGEFYCASPRLMKAMSLKECSKYIGIRQHGIVDWSGAIAENAANAAARIAYLNLYGAIVPGYVLRKRLSPVQGSSIGDSAFWHKIWAKDNPADWEMAFGAFWSDTSECDGFLEAVKENIHPKPAHGRLIAAGLSAGKAKALMDAVLGQLEEDFSGSELYLYGLTEKKYFAYPSMEALDEGRIFGAEEDAGQEEASETEEKITSQEGSSQAEGEMSRQEEAAGQEKGTAVQEKAACAEEKPPAQREAAGAEQEGAGREEAAGAEQEETAQREDSAPEQETERDILCGLLAGGKFYAAAAYARSAAGEGKLEEELCSQLSYALNDPWRHCVYSTDNAFQLITKNGLLEDSLTIATALRTFFSNQVPYDYNIKSYYDGIKNYEVLGRFAALSQVVYSLMDFKSAQNRGMDAYAGYRAKSQAQLEEEVGRLRHEAEIFYDNFVVGRKKENASQKRFLETKKLMFSVNSDIGQYIKSAADGDLSMLPLIEDFLRENFFKEEEPISETAIDGDKLWDYIVSFWDEAGDSMMYRRRVALTSHLKSNIVNLTTRAVQLLSRWHTLLEQMNRCGEDAGTAAYQKLKDPLLQNISEALDELGKASQGTDAGQEWRAGLSVLEQTLREIKACIEGTFSEHDRRYFYADFLLTDEVMLSDNFMPDLELHGASLKLLNPCSRILRHVRRAEEEQPTFRTRLDEILEEQGDDYGAARLIVEYLQDKEPAEDLERMLGMVDAGESYAQETAELRKADFTGELELAQSYGQIDNSVEDKKEKILQDIDNWYEWALGSANFGFFKKVMDGYLAEIRETARARETDLREQLKVFKETAIQGLSAEAKEKKTARIEAMIREQNYTVAEDLLARAPMAEGEHEELLREDFLEDFLDNYDDYYQPVATHRSNFASLVSSRTRNKEERGAKKLADSWLPGGSSLGRERLISLLSSLGFRVNSESVKEQSPIGRFENFFVKTIRPQGGQRENYTHPIAAFGSGAANEGFRVVCVNGGYDADGLIDVMKQIGNARHTLLLIDYALPKAERRILARKSKNALGDKFFGVVDRTVMMFLVRNFDETKINRMLISLIAPFGYYQPYVWESANVMPPEIFMGRKLELERIKSPSGANIVYGGRQLGKSALLKKAKEDVDRDENGNRAVYIDIKGLDYQAAARKIGHELYDQQILENDIDTTDWDELARAIKRRLQSEKEWIPYLLLLLDEADAFIESCEAVNYKPFDALKEVQGIGIGRFKFVIAGLHNIVRFKREAALGNNSVLTHLESMTVKPFNTSEARELLELPLHYLGLRFPKEKESLITLILAATNYFPGLIQLYCAKLLEAMRNKDYAGYDEADTPVYEVSEDHIKKILADPEFTQQIREKYVITLKLDEDNYYYLIALLMAYLYHTKGSHSGYTAADIKNMGCELGIAGIAGLDTLRLEAFMEELKELNVLRSTDETHYLFTRFTFFQMMGTVTEVEDKLVGYMEE